MVKLGGNIKRLAGLAGELTLLLLTLAFVVPAIFAAIVARITARAGDKTRILLAGVETSANLHEIAFALAEDSRYSVSLARFGSHPFYSAQIDALKSKGIKRVRTFEAPNGTRAGHFSRGFRNFITRQNGVFFIFLVFFKYDVVFFNWIKSFMAFNLDYALVRLAGRKLVVRHCGSDVRYYPLQHSVHSSFGVNQWQYGKSNGIDLWSKFFTQLWAERTSTVVSTRDHATFQTRSLVKRPYVQVPLARTSGFQRKVPLIIHAPSKPAIKGTDIVKQAIEILRGKGLVFEFRVLSGVPHRQVLAALSETMIVVDQPGAVPARLAVEGMTAGCAVFGGDVPEIHMLGEIPMVRFKDDADSLADAIRALLLNRQACEDLGNRAREYALDHFSRPAFRAYFEKVLNGQAETFEPMSGRIPLMEAGANSLSEKIAVALLKSMQK